MPGRLLGFDFGSSPLLRPVPEKKRNSSSGRPDGQFSAGRESMEHLKRPVFGRHSSSERKDKQEKRDSSVSRSPKNVKLDMIVESPPALFMDSPQQSSGALFSGRLQCHVRSGPVTITSYKLVFRATTTTKRPVGDHCKDCSVKTTDLREWNIMGDHDSFIYKAGVHDYPFSYLIPGHLPTSTSGHIGKIEYGLFAYARSSTGELFEYSRPVNVRRAIRPGNEKNSVRIFPPTNLTLNVTLPNVVHPIGDFNVYCRMSGITTFKEDTQMRWRLRKLTWRIEEHETMVSPACAKHASKVGGEGRGVQHEHSRDIGSEELKQGWKTDFADGQLEGEFVCAIDNSLKPQCDVESPSGLKINHVLVLELVIAEEWAPNKKPHQATPTGAARVLRTQFNLTVTERGGMGLAWDDEQPPLYEDVPASPPGYSNPGQIEDYDGAELHDDIENLHI
ncbi:hypothetical protein AAFC00_002755 [Neodothiora populina]|uniref:LDB19 N-terminal domain-containing protein n=1 Tax=Neodothiora populina TaxID=2781224 RepID=A0ABR3P8V0_9PEZI